MQRVWNDWTLAAMNPPDSAARFRDLHRLLEETDLETFPLQLMGGNAAQLRILDARGDPRSPEALLKLGQQALAERRDDDAVELLRRARLLQPKSAIAAQLNVYALCRVGRFDEARGIAQRERRKGPLAKDEAFWRWLDATFGLGD